MKSVLQNIKACYLCNARHALHEHHIFEGAYRGNSERFGLKVYLCVAHHTAEGAHADGWIRTQLHKAGQRKFEENHTRAEFIRYFGKSYL